MKTYLVEENQDAF